MLTILATVVPVFAIVALGALWAGRRHEPAKSLADVTMLVLSPALVFTSLSHTSLDLGSLAALGGGTLFVIVGSFTLTWFERRHDPETLRGALLATGFWNAGNLTLPIALYAFGPEGLEAATLVFVTVLMSQSVGGIWIAKGGRAGWREVLRMPFLYASAAGLLVAWTGLRIPVMIERPISMLADACIPCMLLHLGVQLRRLEVTQVASAVRLVAIRMVGGLLCAIAFTTLFGIDGTPRDVLLLASAMPSAVLNVMFAERYDASPGLVASAIVLGTLASLVTIPLLLAFLL